MVEVISHNQNVKARKEHTCDYCLSKIKTKEVYENSILEYEGSIYQWKIPKECSWMEVELNMFSRVDGEGLDEYAFREFIDEAYNQVVEKYDLDPPVNPSVKDKVNILYNLIFESE